MAAQLASVPMISYTSLWNLTGNPAASVPAGFDDATGLPLAIQLVAAPGREDTIFAAAGQLERAHPWADTHPAL
ncbi:MAG TPA: amidase family protein [Dermatophilaceae bacterium]|nr:amidase family protein [Dermatophilaceae bacterium]